MLENDFLNSYAGVYKCKFCNIEICNWNVNGDPNTIHKNLSLNCKKKLNEYKNKNQRIKSFENKNWKQKNIDVEKLVMANFFYTGIEDIVKCWKCEKSFTDWKKEDDPFKLHPKCNLIPIETFEVNEKFTCSICFVNIRNVLFLPCRHCTCCLDCSLKVNKCPICTECIKHKLTIFF